MNNDLADYQNSEDTMKPNQKIDSEMTRILTDEEEFDTNILKLKQEIDKLLNQ